MAAVSSVLHNNAPVASVLSVEVPLQLLTTLTEGAEGAVTGTMDTVAGRPVQPFAVCVTE
jgi:hypothetical protein